MTTRPGPEPRGPEPSDPEPIGPLADLGVVVLAGGRSARFGRDKLAEPIDGRPMLHLVIAAVQPIVAELVVVVAPDAPDTSDVPAALPPGIRVVHDPVAFEGPLAGAIAGLDALGAERALVVAGDMPGMAPAVLGSMAATLADPTVAIVALDHDGRARPLPIAVRRSLALAEARRAFDAGERRLRVLLERLPGVVIPEATWRRLDPGAETVRDIDTPADLA